VKKSNSSVKKSNFSVKKSRFGKENLLLSGNGNEPVLPGEQLFLTLGRLLLVAILLGPELVRRAIHQLKSSGKTRKIQNN
jgi:hypothetical protein